MATNVTVDCTDVTIVTAGQQGPQGPAGPTGPLDTLSDVTITSVVDGQVLTYDSGSGEWVNETPSGGSVALNDLTDVTITGPIADNELLAFDFGSNLWINQTNTEAAVADRVHTHVEADITDLGAYVEAGDSITWTGANTFTGVFNVGDPGSESGSVLVNGASFPAVAKVNRFGSAAEAELILHRHSTTDGSHFLFSRALSNDATHADVINGTSLGDIVCTGWHTNSYWLGGIIRGSVDGTPTLGGMPTRLDFFTSAVGSASPTLRMSVRADGTIDVVGDINMGTNLITDTKVGQWDTSFSWGDHSTEGYLKNVLEDTTPQLGGNLDRNGNEIVGYTVSRALQTSIAGAIEVSAVTSTELGYVSGVTSAIQTQIDGKEPAFTKNTAFNKDFGAIAGTVCEGDDSRLSDNRTDADAIHDNVSGEISLITEKTAPVNADLIIIEDSAATNAKKRVQIGNLPNPAIQDNLIINPSFRIWQRNTSFTTANGYTADRWEFTDVGAGAVTVSRSTGGPTGTQYAWEANVTTADASIAAGDLYTVNQPIEGSNIHETRIGTASAESVTVTFDVYSAVTGTHCISLRNSAVNRSYVAEYTISSANTWETKIITIALDTTGTWLYDIGIGLNVTWCLAGGSTFQTTAGSWAAGNFVCSSNQVNVMGTIANKFRLSDIKVQIGIQSTLFRSKDIESELANCQRYYEKSYDLAVNPGAITSVGAIGGRQVSGNLIGNAFFKERKRTIPTMVYYSPATGSSGVWRRWTAPAADLSVTTTTEIVTGEMAAAYIIFATDGNLITGHYTADAEL